MSRTDWAVLALRIFERIVWFQSLYWLVAAFQKCRAFYQELGSYGLFWEAFDLISFLASALTLQAIAWYLRTHATFLVDLSGRTEDDSADHDPQEEDSAEPQRDDEAARLQCGAELIIATFFIFGTCSFIPAMDELIIDVRWYLLAPGYEFGREASEFRNQTLLYEIIPSAIDSTLALVLIVFARPLAIRLTCKRPADELADEIDAQPAV